MGLEMEDVVSSNIELKQSGKCVEGDQRGIEKETAKKRRKRRQGVEVPDQEGVTDLTKVAVSGARKREESGARKGEDGARKEENGARKEENGARKEENGARKNEVSGVRKVESGVRKSEESGVRKGKESGLRKSETSGVGRRKKMINGEQKETNVTGVWDQLKESQPF